jgi:hypothetical protein
MTGLDKMKERIYNGYFDVAPKKLKYLAYLSLHMENPGLHPDDHLSDEGGYQGWMVILTNDVITTAADLPDAFHYPCAFLRIHDALSTLDDFHASDEEPDYSNLVDELRAFFDDMTPDRVVWAVVTLRRFMGLHEPTDPDDENCLQVQTYNTLKDCAEVLDWLAQFC